MKVLLKKFRNTKLSTRITYLVALLVFLVSYILFLVNVLRLSGIETLLRVIVLIVLGLILFLYGFIDLLLLIKKKHKTVYFSSVFIILISAGCIIGSMTINRILTSMDSLSKDTIVYTTNLIALNGTEFVNDNTFNVGIIDNDTDVEGNVLAYELINKEGLKIKLEKYNSYFEMLEDMYNKKIKGMFVSSNYVITYSTYDGYENIKEETKVLYSYSKEMKNQDYIENYASVDEPFTVLLMGVDSTASTLKASASFNGDTLMMISFNPHTLNATVFSIPRDTYVPIACVNGDSSKINSSGAYGTKCVINTVQNLTGIKIDYYVKVDFQGVIDLVNAVGGIDVTVPEKVNFCESNQYRSMRQEDLICINEGPQHMNGEQALAFARHRKTLPAGDFQRVQHQQLVVEGAAKAVKNVSSVNDFYTILDTLAPNIDTNMKTKEMLALYGVAKTTLQSNNGSVINVEKTYLTGYDLTMYVNNLRGNVYTFQYYEQSLQEIVDAMKVTLGQKKASLIKTFSFSANEPYEAKVVGQRYFAVQRNETVPDFTGKSLDYVKEWANMRNLTVNVNFINPSNPDYDEEKQEGEVVGQLTQKGKLVKDITVITVNCITHYNPDNTTTTTTTKITSSTESTSTTETTTTTTEASNPDPNQNPGGNE